MTALAPSTLTAEDLERHRRELHVHCYRMPAAVSHLRAPGDTLCRAFELDVLNVKVKGDRSAR